MAPANPATFVVELLKAVQGDGVLQGDGSYASADYENGLLMTSLGMMEMGGFEIAETVVALGNALDWLIEAAPFVSSRKQERYVTACEKLKTRLSWELHPNHEREDKPSLQVLPLIVEFEHFADDLEDFGGFNSVSEEQVSAWMAAAEDLRAEIESSALDPKIKNLLIDVLRKLKEALEDLRRFGPASCSERLKDALGRLGIAQATMNSESLDVPALTKLWTLWAGIMGATKTIDDARKAMGGIMQALGVGHTH